MFAAVCVILKFSLSNGLATRIVRTAAIKSFNQQQTMFCDDALTPEEERKMKDLEAKLTEMLLFEPNSKTTELASYLSHLTLLNFKAKNFKKALDRQPVTANPKTSLW